MAKTICCDKKALTVNGKTIWENNKDAPCHNRDVITPFRKPFKKNTGIAVLRGNLCPDGAIIKPSAATPKLMKHRGRAVVFENIEDFHKRIDDPKLDIDEKCVMVLKNCGPKGYPGMAEVGNMPLPPKLLKKGVTDMVRISDARMSGTAYGTVVLHMVPEAAAGGPLALVQNGDMIELDVAKRKLNLLVSSRELQKRKQKWKKPRPPLSRRLLEALLRPRAAGRPGRGPRFPRRQIRAPSCRATTTSALMSEQQEHVLGEDGQFHVEDEAVDLAVYRWEDWASLALFATLAFIVFYQVFTRYVMNDPAGWTEEIARYFLVAIVFIGAAMSVRKNNHIQVDYFYRLIPKAAGA